MAEHSSHTAQTSAEAVSALPGIRYWLLLLASLALILAPLCVFPLSLDHSIYVRAGDCLVAGGKLYQDFIDVKPPLLYYSFAAIRAVVGQGEYAFRYADFVFQIVSCSWLCFVMLRLFHDHRAAFLSAVLYALCYIAPGFSVVMQPDTMTMPLFVGVVFCMLRPDRKWLDDVLLGVFAGLLIGFKYTFGIVLPAIVLIDLYLLRRSLRAEFTSSVRAGLGLLLGLGLSFFCLLDPQVRSAYSEVLSYLKQYTAYPPVDLAFVKVALKAQANYLGDMLSLSIVLFIVRAVASVIYPSPLDEREDVSSARQSQLIASLLLFSLLLWITVIIEKKFIMNHFMRAYVPLMMLAGFGASQLYRQFKEPGLRSFAQKFVWATLLSVFLAFSPLPRWFSHLQLMRHYLFNPQQYEQSFEDDTRISFERTQVHEISRYILDHRQAHERTLVMGVGIMQVYQELREPVWSRFGDSHFYFASGVPLAWKAQMRQELSKADWLVVGTRDNNPVFNGHGRSSYESLQMDPVFATVQQDFSEVLSTRSIKLYHRIGPALQPTSP